MNKIVLTVAFAALLTGAAAAEAAGRQNAADASRPADTRNDGGKSSPTV